jgi:tetratricopeptide (TPR) repeat protein
LALVAARAATRPRVGLQVLVGELADARQRWQMLTGDDPHTDVQAVFSWSYHALTPETARLFRLLGLHPGPDITAPAAASLAGITPDALRPQLAELTRASLLTEPTTGRYTYHDLLRDYATQARSHRILAEAYTFLDRLDDAHTQLDHALELTTQAGDQIQQANTHLRLTTLWDRQGEPTQALQHARQALHLYQTADHQVGQAEAVNAVGWCHARLGEHQAAP